MSKIPTPAEIIKLCRSCRLKRLGVDKLKKLSDFDGDWKAYNEYLNEEKEQ
jgi:hypothetical protein